MKREKLVEKVTHQSHVSVQKLDRYLQEATLNSVLFVKVSFEDVSL